MPRTWVRIMMLLRACGGIRFATWTRSGIRSRSRRRRKEAATPGAALASAPGVRHVRPVRRLPGSLLTVAAVLLVAAPATPAPAPKPVQPRDLPGWGLYDRLCVACHGSAGDGRGPAAPWVWPRPRDLT